MFKSTIETFCRYYRQMDASGVPTFNKDLGSEVRERLEQLQFIINKVHDLRTSLANLPKLRLTSEQTLQLDNILLEMKVLTESFYYLAFRIRTIVRNGNGYLPGLQNFECVGVRNVRNKLLEHAEGKDAMVAINSFGVGLGQGPILKAVRLTTQVDIFPDKGLFINAIEFAKNLEAHLEDALLKA